MPRPSPSARSSRATPTQIELGIARVEAGLPRVWPLAQGGTAVGTGLNAKTGFAEEFAVPGGRASPACPS